MILSMTGFGRAEDLFEGKKISVEIKSLNSKSFDLNLRTPSRYKDKEFEIRKVLNDKILRGKVDCYINCDSVCETNDVTVNTEIIKNYITQLRDISPDAPEFEYLKMAMRMPDAVNGKASDITDEEWAVVFKLINESLEKFAEFRKTEGWNLQKELAVNIQNIDANLALVQPFEEERINTVRERYTSVLKEFENVDETRFFQEMAYYTEKLDISEEKVRLAQHLKYYQEVMQNEDFNGKKLGFITQEIGREINTLGSKASHHEIQKLVVKMKDDLEKIKEQTLNVL